MAETGRQTTELRILITEDADGNLDVEWEPRIKGSEVLLPMRPAHIIGQLHAAAFIIAAKSYKGFAGAITQAAGNSPEEGPPPKKKR